MRAVKHRAPPLRLQPRAERVQALARLGAVHRHGGLGGVRRRRAGHGGHVVDQRAVGVVADRRDDRDAQHRHRPAQRLVAEREQVHQRAAAAGDDDDLDLLARGEVLQRAGDPRRGVAVLDRREGPHDPPGPAAAAQSGEDVVARLAALAGDDADRARERWGAAGASAARTAPRPRACAAAARAGPAGRPRRRSAGRRRRRRSRGRRCASRGSSRSRRRPRPARRPGAAASRAPPSPAATSSTAARRCRRAARSRPSRGRP